MTSPPTSNLDVTGPLAGQLVFSDNNELVTRGVKANVKLSVGQNITFDSNGYMTSADENSTNTDGMGICTVAADNTGGSDGGVSAQAAVGNTYVYGTIGIGGVKNFKWVQIGSGTGKPLIQAVPPAAATTAPTPTQLNAVFNYFHKIFGRYFFHQKEEAAPTAAVSGDVVAIRLGLD